MDTELLKTFLEVQKTRHFGKAADNLYLTQSAVSFRIRQLEQSLGVSLFNRYRNNIQLTTAGEMLLPHAQAVLSAIASAKQQLAMNFHPERTLQLGISPELSVLFAEPAFNQAVSLEQNCQLQFIPTDLLCRQPQLAPDGIVLLGQIDLEMPQWQPLCLGYLEFVAVSATGDEAASEASLGLAKLPRLMQNAVRFCSPQPEVVLNWLLANNACAYLPSCLVERHLLTQQLQRLPYPGFRIPVWAYSPAEATWPDAWRLHLESSATLLSEA